MYTWHYHMRLIITVRQINPFVYITVLVQCIISTPTVGKYRGARCHRITHKRNQTSGRGIGYALHAHSPEPFWLVYFNSNHNYRFSTSSPAAFAISLFSPNKSLIYFYISTKPLTSRPHHGAAHLMQPTPRCLITTQAKNTLKTQCISPELLTCYVPHSLKPQPERLPCSLEYCSGDNGCFVLTSFTTNQPRSHLPALTSMTYRTDKPFGPTKSPKIVDTGLFCREPFLEFLQSSRIIYAANWIWITMAHQPTVTLGQ